MHLTGRGFKKVFEIEHDTQSATEAKQQLIAEGFEPSYSEGRIVFSKTGDGRVIWDGLTATYYAAH